MEVGGLDWLGAWGRQGRIQDDSQLLALVAIVMLASLTIDGEQRGGADSRGREW